MKNFGVIFCIMSIAWSAFGADMVCTGTSGIINNGKASLGQSKYVLSKDGTAKFSDNEILTATGFFKNKGAETVEISLITAAGSSINGDLTIADGRGTGKNAIMIGTKINKEGTSKIVGILNCQ